MKQVSKIAAMVLLTIFFAEHAALALGSKDASYFGGTVTVFGNPKEPGEGRLDMSTEDVLVFASTEKILAGKTFSVRYKDILDLEYGQKAGRRIGAAAATTILLGPIGLLSLFSKKRKHFLTIGFKDEAGKDQVAVMEARKGHR